MAKLTQVSDGVASWLIMSDDLIRAMDTLGWEVGRNMGQRSRTEPGDDDRNYIALCNMLEPIESGAPEKWFTYEPEADAWIWS